MQKISNTLTPILVLILLGVVIHDKFFPPKAELNHDPIAVKLGKDYRKALDELGSVPFDTIANGSFEDTDALTKAQQAAFTSALTNAYKPIADELEKRFGKAEDSSNTPSIANVKTFFADLSFGYKGK